MMDMNNLLTGVADAVEGIYDGLGIVQDVELRRRGTVRSTVTGNLNFDAPVTVRAKISGSALLKVDSDRSILIDRLAVCVFGVAASPGDKISWDGQAHVVREVRGIVGADGNTFFTIAMVD